MTATAYPVRDPGLELGEEVPLAWHRTMPELAFAALICHGVFERFPTLRTASIETGAMWVPDLLRNLQAGAGKMPFAFKQHPVEQFREHVWVAPFYEDDMAMLKDAIGIERLLFGSDFPHT